MCNWLNVFLYVQASTSATMQSTHRPWQRCSTSAAEPRPAAQIADTLSLGIAFDDVLDSSQLSGNNTSVSRLHFVSKQDLQNITREFGLASGITQYANDADGVAAWVINQQGGLAPMACHVKFPGAEDTERGLGEHDFMLVITSAAQIALLQQLFLTAPGEVVPTNHMQELICLAFRIYTLT